MFPVLFLLGPEGFGHINQFSESTCCGGVCVGGGGVSMPPGVLASMECKPIVGSWATGLEYCNLQRECNGHVVAPSALFGSWRYNAAGMSFAADSAIAHAILDLASKNAWSMMGHFLRVKVRGAAGGGPAKTECKFTGAVAESNGPKPA